MLTLCYDHIWQVRRGTNRGAELSYHSKVELIVNCICSDIQAGGGTPAHRYNSISLIKHITVNHVVSQNFLYVAGLQHYRLPFIGMSLNYQ